LDLLWKEGQLSSVRFEYDGKIYETYEPYFIVSNIAKSKKLFIKDFLEISVSQPQDEQ
jgi:hypothetical protein